MANADLAPVFLLVEDEAPVARAFASLVRRHAAVEVASTLAEASAALRRTRFTGIVLDLRLPDGSGLELLQYVRQERRATPVLVVTGDHEPTLANRVHRLGAVCVFKPDVVEDISLFVRRAMADEVETRALAEGAVRNLRAPLRLSRREAELAVLATLGFTRTALAEELGVTENTVKSTVRGLLRKFDETSVDGVARIVLQEMVRLASTGVQTS